MKYIKMFGIFALVFLLTGCVKMDYSMEIKNDKSMDLVMIEAVNQELLEESGSDISSLIEKEELEKLEKKGYQVKTYKKDAMVGYQIEKKIKNIDTVSSTKKISSNLGIRGEQKKNIFSYQKGFFKNTYQANLTINDSKEVINGLDEKDTISEEIEDSVSFDEDSLLSDTLDYSSMMSSMDLKFKVKLPYKAIHNNATEKSKDQKILTWDLLNFKEDVIQFEFSLYNWENIMMVLGGIVFLLVLLLFIKRRVSHSKIEKEESCDNVK